MPSYLGGSVSIYLCTAELDLTVTQNPWNHVGSEPTHHLDRVAKVFREEAIKTRLKEHIVQSEDQFSMGLRFLGPQHNMPFFLVEAEMNDHQNHDYADHASTYLVSRKAWNRFLLDNLNFPSTFELPDSFVHPENTECTNLALQASTESAAHGSQVEDGLTNSGDTIPSQLLSIILQRCQAELNAEINGQDGQVCNTLIYDLLQRRETQQCFRVVHTKPQALCIAVDLAAPAFLSLPRGVYDLQGSRKALDLKIDVFYNGSFENTAFISERVRKSDNSFKLTLLFHGRRIGRLLETPWVLVPFRRHAESMKEKLGHHWNGQRVSEERWKAMNDSLRAHAEVLGRDGSGHLTILGQYLDQVASVSMPPDLSRRGSPNFGVIDIVVSVGRGRKDDSSARYNTLPTPVRLSELQLKRGDGRNNRQRMDKTGTSYPLPGSPSHTQDHSSTPTLLQKPDVLITSESRGPNHKKNLSEILIAKPLLKRSKSTREDALSMDNPQHKCRIIYPDGDAKLPALQSCSVTKGMGPGSSGEFDSINTLSSKNTSNVSPLAQSCSPKRQNSDSMPRSPKSPTLRVTCPNSGGGPGINHSTLSKIDQNTPFELYKGSDTTMTNISTANLCFSRARSNLDLIDPITRDSKADTVAKTRDPARIPVPSVLHAELRQKAETQIHSSQVQVKKMNALTDHEVPGVWTILIATEPAPQDSPQSATGPAIITEIYSDKPESECLSRDCIISFAKDKVRQVKSERGGQFHEAGILVGVRYLLG